MCVLEDVPCITKGGNVFFKSVTKRYDPLYLPRIDERRGQTLYTLTDIKLMGLQQCSVTKLRLMVPSQVYEHYVSCPSLTASFYYQISTIPGPNPGNRTPLTVGARDYRLLNYGNYGIFVSRTDNLPHFFLQSANTKVALRDGNETDLADYLLFLVMKRAMGIVLEGVDAYFQTHLMAEVFPLS